MASVLGREKRVKSVKKHAKSSPKPFSSAKRTGRGTGATAPAAVARRVGTTIRVVVSPAPKRRRQSSASGDYSTSQIAVRA